MQKVVASVEARMTSSRLPGKMLADIHGAPTIARVFQRLRSCRRLDDVVLATSIDPSDDILADWALSSGIPCYRGSLDDVLGRVAGAHRYMGSDLVVEATGDCPLLDPETIDLGIDTFLLNTCNVVTNCRQHSYPEGADVQVFRLDDLTDVAKRIADPAVREHVSLYFYENPDRYRIIHLSAPHSVLLPNQRLQLDYPEDLEFIRAVYAELEPLHGSCFGLREIVRLLRDRPDIRALNANCIEKPVRA